MMTVAPLQQVEPAKSEIERLRALACACYAGLGSEHNLPEQWLDVFLAAAEGRPFETDGLLPYTCAPQQVEPGWQPIETAPRDGQTFVTARFVEGEEGADYEIGRYRPLLCNRFVEAEGGLFRKETETLMEWDFSNWHRMTHWAPLLVAPKEPKP